MEEVSKNGIIIKCKDLYKNLILNTIHWLSNYYRKLNKNNPLSNPRGFEDFTPIILDNDDDKYSEIIKYSVDNINTKNVALTGPYGSGKSSILKTFEDRYTHYKYLNISLATFDEKDHNLKDIEYCILKQLFYKVEQNKIPESRFKRIVNQKNIEIKSVFIFLWLISLTYFFNPNLLKDIIKILGCDFYSKIGNIIYTLYFLGGAIYFLYKTMGFILNFKLTKFSFQDAEIENSDDKKSVNFENEIDEILYFFEKNPFNVVFIEDLDRFKNTEIFIKLREINYLINNYDPIKTKRKITFIYAVQDDTFKQDERAKFFDFIVPVIPVINYSNSSSELLENKDIIKDEIPKSFIKQVARYLSDKRTLISINNEYKIYNDIIGDNLDKTKLLAMMMYKNVEPTDFDNLNSQKGYVYKIFNQLGPYFKNKSIEIDKQIETIESNIDVISSEIPQNVKELRSFYIMRFYENQVINFPEINSIKSITIDNKECSITEILEDDNFKIFTSINKNITFSYHTYHNNNYSSLSSKSVSFSFKDLESEIGNYKDRCVNLDGKKRINELKKEIEKLVNEKQALTTKKVKDIITDKYFQNCLDGLKDKISINVKEIIEGKEIIITKDIDVNYKIQNIELINFLIRYGHIDESYSHYISYFYPGTITTEDNDFLKSFTNNKPLPYNFELKEIENLFPDILESDFSREGILNFSLLDYILKENNKEKELAQIIELLSTSIQKPSNFIDEYIDYASDKNKKLFLKALCKFWKNTNQNIWEIIMIDFSDDKCIYYLNLMFSTLDLNTLHSLNVRDNLSTYISEIKSLKSFINIDIEINTFTINTNLKFKNIDYEGSSIILDSIYNNNNYEINEKMIELFVNLYKQNKLDIDLLKEANYTTIKKSGALKLIKYIDLNIEFYIKTVFLKLENNCHESEEIIIELLNDNYEDFGPELAIEIINKNQTPIHDISKLIHSELWAILLNENKIVVSWNNLLYYFREKKSFDDILVRYLNIEENYTKLKHKIDKNLSEDFDLIEEFIVELLQSVISINAYTFLVKNLPVDYCYSEKLDNFSEISIEKMKVLIENKIIALDINNYNFIKSKFTVLLPIFLESNITEFINDVETYELDSSVALQLIDSRVFTYDEKITIINNTSVTIISKNKDLSNKICKLLTYNKKTKISIDLLKDLITQSNSLENKIRLFNKYQDDISSIELKSIITLLGSPYSEIIEGKQPKFENKEYNIEFINQRKKDYITKTSTVDEGKFIKVFTKRKVI